MGKTWAKKARPEECGNGFYEVDGRLQLRFTLADPELFSILFCGRFHSIPFSQNLAGERTKQDGLHVLTDAKLLSIDHVLAIAMRIDLENVERYSEKHAPKLRLLMGGRGKEGVYREGKHKLVVCEGKNITQEIREECQEWIPGILGDDFHYAYSEGK